MAYKVNSKWRTPGGDPTAEAAKKFGYKDSGMFPVFDEQSAHSALQLRGKSKTKAMRLWILRTAAPFLPEEARAAMDEDKKAGVISK